jgi:hypothetical protein
MIDWEAVVDRTRNIRMLPHWSSPAEILSSCAAQFSVDKWAGQPIRPEVFVEKDALIGIVEAACNPLDVPYFSCRGYTSLSEIWSAAQRMIAYRDGGQTPFVFHLGDHDPSGVDMSRDIHARLLEFGVDVELRRIALNMDQVQKYKLPRNPAKTTDIRFAKYKDKHGIDSWELDALDPPVLVNIITQAVKKFCRATLWDDKVAEEREGREQLRRISDRWNNVTEFVENP